MRILIQIKLHNNSIINLSVNQGLDQTKFNAEGDFLVKQSFTVNVIIGILLLVIFSVAAFSGDYGWGVYIKALCLFLIPAAVYLGNARRKAAFIKINKTGLYYKGRLVTDWNSFAQADITQDEIPGSINDNFVLIIQFYGGDPPELYVYKIPLSNTQDKGDEEILEAIRFYYDENIKKFDKD